MANLQRVGIPFHRIVLFAVDDGSFAGMV